MSFLNSSYEIDFIIIAISIIIRAKFFFYFLLNYMLAFVKYGTNLIDLILLIWNRTHNFTFNVKYGTIPYFKGRLATLTARQR